MYRACCLMVCIAASTAAGETLESVEKTLAKKLEGYKSMTAKMNMKMEVGPGMASEGNGLLEFMRKDGKEMSRSEINMNMDFGGQSMQSTMVNIFDGTDAYSINEMMGQKQVARVNPSRMAGRVGGKAFFEDLHKENNVKLLPDEKLDGKPTYVLQATPKTPDPNGMHHLKYQFEKSTGYLLQMSAMNSGGQAILTMKLSDIKVNTKIDPSRFAFKPSPGTPVMDMRR